MNEKFFVPPSTAQLLKANGCPVQEPTYHEAIDWIASKGAIISTSYIRDSDAARRFWVAFVHDADGFTLDLTNRHATREAALDQAMRRALKLI